MAEEETLQKLREAFENVSREDDFGGSTTVSSAPSRRSCTPPRLPSAC